MTWRQTGIKHDSKHNHPCPSKGFNLKHRSDFMLTEYETRPDATAENTQQVRAVWNGDRWELHLIRKAEIPDRGSEQRSFGTASSPPVQSNLGAVRTGRAGGLQTLVSRRLILAPQRGEDVKSLCKYSFSHLTWLNDRCAGL